MKRALHYLLLAAVLVGLPLGCAWLAGNEVTLRGAVAFPPRTEDWGGTDYWQRQCPFTWWAFVPLAVLIVAVCAPFVRRAWRSWGCGARSSFGSSGQETPRIAPASQLAALGGYASPFMRRFPVWGWLGLAMFLGWLPVVWLRPGWAARLQVHSFAIMGFGHAMLMDALACRRGAVSVFKEDMKGFLLLLPVSALFWWFFEFLNRFSRNWYFINMEDYTTFEYVFCFSLGCATILPSVLTTARWLGTFRLFDDRVCAGMCCVDVGSHLLQGLLAAVALIGLVGVVFAPSVLYPFLWLSPICAFVLIDTLLGLPTGLESLKEGNWSRVWRWAVAMLICGIIWETWGFWIEVRWVYTVPYLHRFCYAEMPLIGFAGYLPFGVEALLVCRSVSRSRR